MEQNTFAARIARYRKEQSMTQEALAAELGLTAQAVSKWENGQGYPDVSLLPRLADLFGVSLDMLFGRAPAERTMTIPQPAPAEDAGAEPTAEPSVDGLPWDDDRQTLHAVLYAGHLLIGHEDVTNCPEGTRVQFCYEGSALNIDSVFSVCCDDVAGSVSAGGSITCDDVGGSASAGGSIACDNVGGEVNAGTDVSCDAIRGNVTAGGSVTCDSIGGSASAGGNITCDELNGDNIRVSAGGSVQIDEVNGSLSECSSAAGFTMGADGFGKGFGEGFSVDVGEAVRSAMQRAQEAMDAAARKIKAAKTPKVTIRYRADAPEAPEAPEAPAAPEAPEAD